MKKLPLADGERIISHTDVPECIINTISKAQQSYLDEFEFHQIDNRDDIDFIIAYYGNEIMAIWSKGSDQSEYEWEPFSEEYLASIIKSDVAARKKLSNKAS